MLEPVLGERSSGHYPVWSRTSCMLQGSREDKYGMFSVMSIMKEVLEKSRAFIGREANHIFLSHYHLVIQVRNLTVIVEFWTPKSQ